MTDTLEVSAIPQPGTRIYESDQLNALPVGSVIAVHNDPDDEYRKTTTAWEHRRGVDAEWSYYHGGFSLEGYNRVISLGDGPEPPPPPMTLPQFMWRYRQVALRGAQVNLDRIGSDVWDLVDGLGCGREDPAEVFAWSVGQVIRNRHDRDRLPEGSVVVTGQPDRWSRFGVYRKTATGGWDVVLGGRAFDRNRVVTVVQVNDSTTPDDWWTRAGDAEDAVEIAAFRRKAWDAGWKLKRARSWCETYEEIIAEAGITEEDG